MPCESIRPAVRKFLDDLLDENDYQDIQAHLADCKHCHDYAASIGTLSYRLYELGQVSVPPDMSSTILYEFNRASHAVSAISERDSGDKTASAGTRLPWIVTLVVLVTAVVAAVTMVSVRRVPVQTTAVAVSGAPIYLTELSQEESPAASVILDVDQSKEIPAHWHYHVSRASLNELQQIFKDLYLTVLDESPSHLVFYVPRERLGEFVSRMTGLTGVVKEFGDFDPSRISAEAVQVSLYLE